MHLQSEQSSGRNTARSSISRLHSDNRSELVHSVLTGQMQRSPSPWIALGGHLDADVDHPSTTKRKRKIIISEKKGGGVEEERNRNGGKIHVRNPSIQKKKKKNNNTTINLPSTSKMSAANMTFRLPK